MGDAISMDGDGRIGVREQAVLRALIQQQGRVVDRTTLRHVAGIADLSPRRCEAILVDIRRVLGADAVVTVRRRGWRLESAAVGLATAIIDGSAHADAPR